MKVKNKLLLILAILLLLLIPSCTFLSLYPLYTDDVLIRNDNIVGQWVSIENTFLSNPDTVFWEISFEKKREAESTLFDSSYEYVFSKKTTVPNKYEYTLSLHSHSHPKKSTSFKLHLIKLNSKTYFDLFPEDWNATNQIVALHLLPTHTFGKISVKSNSITLDWFDPDWLLQKLRKNKIRIKHETNGQDILLTSKPKDLQKFVIKYSEDREAFEDGYSTTLTRKR